MSDGPVTPETSPRNRPQRRGISRAPSRSWAATPNLTELGIFSVMWSEHCSYKSSRDMAAASCRPQAPRVIYGPGENAGVIDIGDGAGRDLQDGEPQPPLLHRALSGRGDRRRRHPARRLHHGRAADRQSERAALRRARTIPRRGISSPAWSPASAATAIASACRRSAARCNFHPAYNGNILVNAMTRRPRRRRHASSIPPPRAPAIRWSMSAPRPGATASTARPWPRPSSARTAEEKRPTVQVGDPFTEKLLIEACLELMATDAIVAIQDMGAAGLTSSSVEMAGKGGLGIELDLDQRAAARDRHDRLRDHALGKPGAHADGPEARARGRGAARSSRNGSSTSPSSAASPTPAAWSLQHEGRGRRRHAGRAAGRPRRRSMTGPGSPRRRRAELAPPSVPAPSRSRRAEDADRLPRPRLASAGSGSSTIIW